MRTIDVGLRLGDTINPFHLANCFEVLSGTNAKNGAIPPSLTPTMHTIHAQGVTKQVSGSLSGTLLRVTGPLPSLVLRAEDMWQRHNVSK